jgi:uncharacterized protein (UPF0332 family)
MNGEDFIALAGRLAAAPHADEATYRTAVSRSYYGAFHVVRRFFGALTLKVSRDHGDFQRCLIECGHARTALAGRYLNDLHSSRIKADYDLSNSDVAKASHARECVELATDICSLLEQLDAAEKSLVKAGIEAYRQRIAPGQQKPT